MPLVVAHLNAGVILVVTHRHAPFTLFSPSLINLMVSVDVKYNVYLLTAVKYQM